MPLKTSIYTAKMKTLPSLMERWSSFGKALPCFIKTSNCFLKTLPCFEQTWSCWPKLIHVSGKHCQVSSKGGHVLQKLGNLFIKLDHLLLLAVKSLLSCHKLILVNVICQGCTPLSNAKEDNVHILIAFYKNIILNYATNVLILNN